MRARAWIALGVAALGIVAVGTWWLAGRDAAADRDGDEARSVTATVERRDLIDRETVDGTLGYDDAITLSAPVVGTLTALPDEGATIGRGAPLYEVDGVPVPLLFGDTPAWRTLSVGVDDGVDVLQLERNLAALGYGDGLDVDRRFDGDTAEAVRDLQADLGVDETGVVTFGSIAFLRGERRVGAHLAQVGQALAPGTGVVETTSTRPVVTVDLPATQRELAVVGEEVTVTMPDDREVTGVVRRVGTVAAVSSDDPTGEPTIEVVVSIRPSDVEGGLDGAPVDVGFASDVQDDAVAAPVTALLALAEGGYALEVVADDGSTRLVGVEVGVFADGWVAVDGDGIEPGVEVVVAA
jgi:multidrug efflux system membrane fusion protein